LLVYEQFFAVMSLKEKASVAVVAGDSRERLAFHSFQLVSFGTDAAQTSAIILWLLKCQLNYYQSLYRG
jgi:hypothetical protein